MNYPAIHMANFFLSRTEKRSVGRPRLIEDHVLESRLARFLEFFEYHWAEVAWDLSEAKTLPALRDALRRAKRESVSELQPFVTDPTSRTTIRELRELRGAERRINALLRPAYEDQRIPSEKLERAVHAVNANPGDERLQRLKAKHEQNHVSAQNQLGALREEGEKLEERIKQKEAFFAQSELLDFIRSNRYTLTPVSYAKAMAGLPYITWRQSAARLAKKPVQHPFGVEYEKFRIVFRGLANAPRKPSKAIQSLKAFLIRSRPKSFALSTLKSEWYFLRCALETVLKQKEARQAIRFRVFAEYQSRTRSRSAADMLLQEDEAIP